MQQRIEIRLQSFFVQTSIPDFLHFGEVPMALSHGVAY